MLMPQEDLRPNQPADGEDKDTMKGRKETMKAGSSGEWSAGSYDAPFDSRRKNSLNKEA